MTLETMDIQAGEVHLYSALPDKIKDEKLLLEYYSLMSAEEREQYQRFQTEKLKHDYLITRALVRSVLSSYAAIKPKDWRFSKNEYGKPEIIRSEQIPNLRFNLSHTKGIIICAITLDQNIGVDVENKYRKSGGSEIAKRYFSEEEFKELSALEEEKRSFRFFEYWTLKEAYIKACGQGLSIPLAEFSFSLNSPETIYLSFNEKRADCPENWNFSLYQIYEDFFFSLALKQAPNLALKIKMHEIVPLSHSKKLKCIPLRKTSSS